MSAHAIDVVAAGHICVDITPQMAAGPGEVFRPGGLSVVGPASISTGGPVSNTGLAMRRLGLNVSLMGKCGDDPLGALLLEALRNEAPGAEAGMNVVPGETTSYSVVLAPPEQDRMFLHCPGANDTFGPEDVDADAVARARLFHFGYPPIMRRMYADEGRELVEMLQRAHESGTVTSLDTCVPDPDSDAGRADWNRIFAAALPHTDIFLPSLEEILFMLERRRFDELSAGAEGIVDSFTSDDVRRIGERCIAMGARVVVIKCGHVGAYLRTSGSVDELADVAGVPADWKDVEWFEPTCRVETVASTTGSGDSSIAGFLAALLRGEAPAWCMAALTAVGAQNLGAWDAVSGVRTWDETLAELAGGPPKNPVPERLSELA